MTKDEQLKTNKLRKRKCKTCREWFRPENEVQRTCMTAECSMPFSQENAAKERRKAATESKQNTRSKLKARAEKACNSYIRARDNKAKQPCISCGYIWVAPDIGRKQNAGHYESVAKRADLRYNEDNIHLQCEPCNTSLSGNLIPYRVNLIKKIGLETLLNLEENNTPRKYEDDELRAIEAHYKKKEKELEDEL